eukprot:CAMPEP_0205999996 /NCGR_PEP_ID=MMETSP1464-20131121/1198_1 /ASSEMBLY_ACC=CAM_ASM_001124 /TAXON_ID=119497 /ORGANISM="Exanthemachrysis gayraliae, Strain RCC1523" /LENGTH=67 /DNA_ID=CAMNT_0053373233 /DNA_START=15 /DNA_END=216 /DNA_ORIENTATION=+
MMPAAQWRPTTAVASLLTPAGPRPRAGGRSSDETSSSDARSAAPAASSTQQALEPLAGRAGHRCAPT